MDSHAFSMQADRQVPSQESSDRNTAQVPAPERGPSQLLRVAARKLPRRSAYATTTPYAFSCATRSSQPQDLIQTRVTASPRPSTVEPPSPLPAKIPLQESALIVKQRVRRFTLKPQCTTKESGFERQSDFTAQGGVGESKLPAGNFGHPRRYGQILPLHKSSLSSETGRKVSQLPLRVDKKNQFQNSAWLAARQPIRGASDILGRESTRRATQGNLNETVGTLIPPITTPSLDIALAPNQEIIVRVGPQSLSLSNIEGILALKDGNTWRSLEDLVGIRCDLK